MRKLSEVLDNAGFFDLFEKPEWKDDIKKAIDATFDKEGSLDVIDDVTITNDPSAEPWDSCLARTTMPFDLELVMQEGLESFLPAFQRVLRERKLELSSLSVRENFSEGDGPIHYELTLEGQKHTILQDASREADYYDTAPAIFEGVIHAMNAFLASKYHGYRFVLVDMYGGEAMFLILTTEKMLACLEAIKDEVSNAIFYLKDGESHLDL